MSGARAFRFSPRLRRILIVALAGSSATGCSGGLERFHRYRACSEAAGEEPHAAAMAFGLFGVAYMQAQDDHKEWAERMHECFDLQQPTTASK